MTTTVSTTHSKSTKANGAATMFAAWKTSKKKQAKPGKRADTRSWQSLRALPAETLDRMSAMVRDGASIDAIATKLKVSKYAAFTLRKRMRKGIGNKTKPFAPKKTPKTVVAAPSQRQAHASAPTNKLASTLVRDQMYKDLRGTANRYFNREQLEFLLGYEDLIKDDGITDQND